MNINNAMLTVRAGQRGISLVELMVAMTLSLVLLAGVVQVFSASKTSYRVVDGLSRLQENGRFAIEYLARETRMAGYGGCSNPDLFTLRQNITAAPVGASFTLADMVGGLDNVSGAGVKAGTDTLIVRYGSSSAVSLSVNMAAKDDALTLASNPDNLVAGDYVLVANCKFADLFQATAVTGLTVEHADTSNTSPDLSRIYQNDAMVMRLVSGTYFINDSGRTDAGGNTINSLFETTLGGTRELAEGIDDMQISYGVDNDTDGAVDVYQTAAVVGPPGGPASNWGNVVSARISLLVSTNGNVSTQVEPYTDLQGVLQTPSDRRIRHTITSTVSIRNRAR